jgi:hypothetical protein
MLRLIEDRNKQAMMFFLLSLEQRIWSLWMYEFEGRDGEGAWPVHYRTLKSSSHRNNIQFSNCISELQSLVSIEGRPSIIER